MESRWGQLCPAVLLVSDELPWRLFDVVVLDVPDEPDESELAADAKAVPPPTSPPATATTAIVFGNHFIVITSSRRPPQVHPTM